MYSIKTIKSSRRQFQFMFIPHMPPWHISAPHMPLPQPGAGELSFAAPDLAANVEYCVVKWSSPQDGHRTASASALRRTNFSNLVPQSSQAYSKIGMLLNYQDQRLAWVPTMLRNKIAVSPNYYMNMRRRRFLKSGFQLAVGAGLALAASNRASASGFFKSSKMVKLVDFTDAGQRKGVIEVEKVVKTDAEWRQQLTPEQYEVTRHAGTERAFTGKYWNNHEHGIYRCVCCGNALFSSDTKFESGTGWPSFWEPIAKEN